MFKWDRFTAPVCPWGGKQPANHGAPWTEKTIHAVIDMFCSGADVADIARLYERTAGSILSMLCQNRLITLESGSYTTYICNINQMERKEMPKLIENQVLILGQDASTKTDDEIFALIGKVEKEIESLDKIQNKPKKLAAKIEALHGELKKLVEYVDGR